MRLWPLSRRRDVPQEQQCPRCGIPAPMDAQVCTACGWDLMEAYHDPYQAPDADRP
jgi:predicted RNA-binding Zn-ribbon protein involved in translation (DUF1610 family)